MNGPSRLDAIKTPKVERVLLEQFHHCRKYVTGTLCLTDRHLIFIEPTGAQETWLLYHHILSVERRALTTRGYPLVIDCKTFQQLNLIIPRESDCLNIMDTIKEFSQPESYRDLFAFQYRPKEGEVVKQSSGWALYDADSEYSRMGVPNELWKATSLNEKYGICETYSSSLYVPAAAEDSVILGSAKFRSKGRLPVLSLYYSPRKSAMCRSSQPLVGLRGRSSEDEQMIQCIVDANPGADLMYMMDTRPKINAMANKAAGKGYESTDHYNNVIYEFYNIHNIHVMRESLQRLVEASCSPKENMSVFLAGIENSGWLKHIHLILEAVIFSAKALVEEGRSVMVHCSDGWDRTAQACALTSLLIDSYYRTLHGFMVLVEKEWLSFGHKFSVRSGHLAGDFRETSPIFTQFLDCVWQVMVQFPTAFQFNEHFLVTLHDHVFSCQFGTFLSNNERERLLNMFSDQTYSLWGYIWTHLDDFINPLYSEASSHEQLLLPNTSIPHLSFWIGLYSRSPLRQHVCELSEEVTGSLRQQNNCLTEHIKFLQQNIEDLKVQLTRFEEANAFCFKWPLQSSTDNSNELDYPLSCADGFSAHVDSNGKEGEDRRDVQQFSDVVGSKGVDTGSRGLNSETVNAGRRGLNGEAVDDRTKANGAEALPKARIIRGREVHRELAASSHRPTDLNAASVAPSSSNVAPSSSNVAPSSSNVAPSSSNVSPSSSTSSNVAPTSSTSSNVSPSSINVPTSNQRDSAQTDSDVAELKKAPTEVMSPRSYSLFKSGLVHVPEMNLPWESMRNATKCGCGVTFSYSVRKYHCSHCGCVVCSSCGNHQAASPWQSTAKPHRVCKSCFKIMKKITQEADTQLQS